VNRREFITLVDAKLDVMALFQRIHGYAATREAAMAVFAKSSRKSLT
jgi:hypothetical protein